MQVSLCHRLLDVILSACLLSVTHTLTEVHAGIPLSALMPLNYGMPEVISGLQQLAKGLLCATASQACAERIFFCQWTALFWMNERYVQFSREKSLCTTQSESVGRNRLSETWCCCYRHTQKRTDSVTYRCLTVN